MEQQTSKLRTILTRGAEFLALLLLASVGASLAARLHWAFDLFSHFVLQYIVGAFLLAALFLIYKKKKWFVTMLGVLLFTSAEYYYNHELEVNFAASSWLTVAQYNRHSSIFDHSEFLTWASENKHFDVIVMQEANAMMSRAAKDLIDDYPYQIHEPRNHSFGMVVLSKHRFQNEDHLTHTNSDSELGVMMKNFYLKFIIYPHGYSEPIAIYALHAVPPLGGKASQQRNDEIKALENAIKNDTHSNVIMIGDWNISPFSPYFTDLRINTGLKNAHSNLYTAPTWPSQFQLQIYQIPIDHILHKGELALVEKKRGPAMGSDHYPVIATYALPAHNE